MKATHWLVTMSFIICSTALAVDPSNRGSAQLHNGDWRNNAEASAAVELAIAEVVREGKQDPKRIEVQSVSPERWSDSSLGCRQPDLIYQPVISEGYVVLLAHGKDVHRVHVSGKAAVICEDHMLTRAQPRTPGQTRSLDVMLSSARQDLAQRLGVDVTAVRVVGFKPQVPNTGCVISKTDKRTAEYQIALDVRGRIYTYHADHAAVRPCPEIAAQ